MNFTTTGRSQVRSIKCCVLFDPADGKIAHTHRIVTMDGAEETPAHLLEERVRHLAKGLGLNLASLELMHVDANDLQPGVIYKVDRHKRCLVATRPVTKSANQQLAGPS